MCLFGCIILKGKDKLFLAIYYCYLWDQEALLSIICQKLPKVLSFLKSFNFHFHSEYLCTEYCGLMCVVWIPNDRQILTSGYQESCYLFKVVQEGSLKRKCISQRERQAMFKHSQIKASEGLLRVLFAFWRWYLLSLAQRREPEVNSCLHSCNVDLH